MRARKNLPETYAQQAVQSAYAMVSAVQHMEPHELVAGIALLFKVVSDKTGVSVSELLNKAERMEKFANDNAYQREIRALHEYVTKELN